MAVLEDAALFTIYAVPLLFVSLWLGNRPRSDKRIVDGFYGYVKRGRVRVPHLADSFLFFAVLQLLYPIPAVVASAAWKTPVHISFSVWFVISLVLFYLFALHSDPVKK